MRPSAGRPISMATGLRQAGWRPPQGKSAGRQPDHLRSSASGAAGLVPRFRSLQALAAPLMRTSESKGHQQHHESSAVLNLNFLHELVAQMNFKFTALVPEIAGG